jgi:hypothetical protein
MMTLRNCRQMVLVTMASLGVTASLRSEPRVTSATPGDETHQQSAPPAQATKSTSPAQTEIDPNSQTKSLGSTNEQVAVKPPLVSYEDGQLTIVAENVSLSAVFDALRRVMGANIEMPPGAADKLIWIRSGPGPARRVLRDLLDGTELDYVIQASETDADGVRSVFLSTRSKGADAGEPGSSPVHGPNRKAQSAGVPPAESPEMDVAPEEKVASSSESAPADPPAPTSPPSVPNNGQTSSIAAAQATMGGSPAGSSEHTTQHLQDLYQQRRQMQMQQNQKLPTTN